MTRTVGQRAAVAASCVVFGIMMLHLPIVLLGRLLLFSLLVLFAAMEKLCSIMNLVAIERDWVRCCVDSWAELSLTAHRWS
jgi:iron-regulated transporter 1